MRDAITKAGLPLDCKPHGLRKTLGRRMADAGCSAHQIMAALGHTTLAEAERYTREADRRRGGRSNAANSLSVHARISLISEGLPVLRIDNGDVITRQGGKGLLQFTVHPHVHAHARLATGIAKSTGINLSPCHSVNAYVSNLLCAVTAVAAITVLI
jgi:hypothetical protein